MVYSLHIVPACKFDIGFNLLDGYLNNIHVLDETPDGGTGLFSGGSVASGRAVETANFPTKMRWEGGVRALPDFDDHHCLNVSEKAKDLIEQIEPNVHQFIPVEIINDRGKRIGRRFFLVVCNRVASLDHEKTTMVLQKFGPESQFARWVPVADLRRNGQKEQIPAHLPHDTKSRVVFSEEQVKGFH